MIRVTEGALKKKRTSFIVVSPRGQNVRGILYDKLLQYLQPHIHVYVYSSSLIHFVHSFFPIGMFFCVILFDVVAMPYHRASKISMVYSRLWAMREDDRRKIEVCFTRQLRVAQLQSRYILSMYSCLYVCITYM